jgi:hypothetical protein
MPPRRTRQLVVVPYVRTMLRPETHRAVLQQRPGAELVELPLTSPTAYARLLIAKLTLGQTVVVVEQDVVPPPTAIRNLLRCRHAWCTHPMRHGGHRKVDLLGLAKFGAWIHTLHPRWVECALLGGLGGYHWPHWRSLDTLIARYLRHVGIEPHVHRPDALHLKYPDPEWVSEWAWPLLTPAELNPHAPATGQTKTPPEVSSDGVSSDVGFSVGGADRGDRAQDDRQNDHGGERTTDDRQRPDDDPDRQRTAVV